MREGRASITSELVAATRALYTEQAPPLAVVDDPLAESLVPAPYRAALRVARALPGGLALLERAAGAVSLGLVHGVALRSAAIDDALRREVARGTRQVVILGAGLDARAWRLPELAPCTVIEVDHPATQRDKRAKIRLAPLAGSVRFAPIDFERQALADVLEPAGHRADAPTAWIWEGVTMYLTREAVVTTLDAVAARSAPGSLLAVTYLPPRHGPRWAQPLGAGLARLVGESLHCRLATAEVGELLESRGFHLERDGGARDFALDYWPREAQARTVTWERTAFARRN